MVPRTTATLERMEHNGKDVEDFDNEKSISGKIDMAFLLRCCGCMFLSPCLFDAERRSHSK